MFPAGTMRLECLFIIHRSADSARAVHSLCVIIAAPFFAALYRLQLVANSWSSSLHIKGDDKGCTSALCLERACCALG
jgi:hypothetical protein